MGFEKMKLRTSNSDICNEQSENENTTDFKGSDLTELGLSNSYLGGWFRCLQLSKQYTQNCRTGLFPTDGAYQTYRLFGSVEDRKLNDWWEEQGRVSFSSGFASLKVQMLVRHKQTSGFQISLDVPDDLDVNIASEEFCLLIKQIQTLNSTDGLLSSAPMAWSFYKSKITCAHMQQLLDVLEAYEKLIKVSNRGNLWQIGEQLRVNPKAMSKTSDSHNERIEKHIAMGKRVSAMLSNARSLVQNACDGIYPRFKVSK
jgi:hypothetical protein